MNFNQRILSQDVDLSPDLNDYRSAAVPFSIDAGEYLYIGQERPFNNLFFDIATVNPASTGVVSVDLWWANQWQAAVDVSDRTAVTGVSLKQSGRIAWNTKWNRGWDWEDRSSRITGLETTEIYDLYWARFSWDAAVTGVTMKSICQKFSGDEELFSQYPDLQNAHLMDAFQSGKTTWDEQSFAAAEAISRDLISRRIIIARGQILDWTLFEDSSIHKTAEIIYAGMGAGFLDQKNQAADAYGKSMNKEKFRVDLDADGSLRRGKETAQGVSFLTR